MTAASSLFLCSQFFSSSQRGTIMSASVLENRLRAKPEEFELRCNDSAKSNVWKHLSLVFEKLRTTSENISFAEVKYFCACNRCRRVYMYKAPDGSSFGTKNLLDHVKSCSGSKPASQLQISQCVRSKPQMTKRDSALLKQMEVEYCVDGYHLNTIVCAACYRRAQTSEQSTANLTSLIISAAEELFRVKRCDCLLSLRNTYEIC